MFLVHPTRLSKIFAEGRTHPCGNARHRQASKLAGRTHAKSRMRSPKMKLLKKNLPGRPYSAPAVARPEFCYHSLHEDHSLYTTLPGAQASPHVERTQTLEIGDSLRISEPLHTSKPGLQLFLCPPAQFCGIFGLFFHYQQLTVVGFAPHHRQKASMVDAETRRHPDAAILTRDCVRLHCTLAGLRVPRGPGGPPSV